jgi:hypothetical protein
MATAPPWLETGWILGTLTERRPEAQRAYRRFVAEGTGQDLTLFALTLFALDPVCA